MTGSLREELEKNRTNYVKKNGEKFSDQDVDQLEGELDELSDIIIDSCLVEKKK